MKTPPFFAASAMILGAVPMTLAIAPSKPGEPGCVVKPPVVVEGRGKGHGEGPIHGDGIAGPCLEAPPALEVNPGFGPALYQQLRGKQGNVFFSPLSISQAMGMAYAGARGHTAAEFQKAMGFGMNPQELAARMSQQRDLIHHFANRNDDKLHIANALCVTGTKPLENYLRMVRTCYGAEAFSGGLEEINGWVKEKTEGHIDKILDELNGNSECVLLNAVYFKGTWRSPFKPLRTHDAPFHPSSGKPSMVRMMAQRAVLGMASTGQWVAVELPYQSSCSMVLVMPAKADGYKDFEAGINEAFVTQVCGQLKRTQQEIDLYLPKFRIATSYDLVPPMKELGMAAAFDGQKADFSGMYAHPEVYISQIMHKATLEVDELGSVASAATAIEMATRGIPMPVPEVRFDRPFLVLIRENQTNTTLFMGRISDLTAK